MTLTKKRQRSSLKRKNNRTKRKRKIRRKTKNQDGGTSLKEVAFILVIFFIMVRYSIIDVLEPTTDEPILFKDINIGGLVDNITPESVGISLVPFIKYQYESFITFCENYGSFVLTTNNEHITSVKLYQNEYHSHYINKLRGFESAEYRERILKDYPSVEQKLEYKAFPQVPDTHQTHYLEDDLKTVYNPILPSLKLLTDGNIPKLMFVSGASFEVSKTDRIFNQMLSSYGDSPWHQDINIYNVADPTQIDRYIRVFIVPRGDYGFEDLNIPDFASQLGEYKPVSNKELVERGVAFGSGIMYSSKNYPRVININMKDEEYMGIVFDNNRIFHRTPNLRFTDLLKGQLNRKVYQLIFKWNHRDVYSTPKDGDSLSEVNKSAMKYVSEKVKDSKKTDEILSSLSEITL